MSMIKWTSKGKEGDPIPWPFRPYCSICSLHTEYVLNPETGFSRAKTYCSNHLPNTKINYNISEKVEEREIENIINVKKKTLQECDLIGTIYTK